MRDILLSVDLERIQKIPFSLRGGSDERVWIASEDGHFRVRDAYNLALNAVNDRPSSSGHDTIWSRLWKLQIPPKAKIFLWRAAWDILPWSQSST